MPFATPSERTAHAKDIWHLWYDPSLGDSDGWWVGWCPLHDKDKQELGSGEYNFAAGVFRCMGTPRCHHKRGMSVSQLAAEMVKRG